MDPITFGGVIIAFVLAVGLVALATRRRHSAGHWRVVATVFLLTVAALCIFGFLASFELPGVPATGMIYAALGIISLIGAGRLVAAETAAPARAEPLLCRTRPGS